MSTTSLLRNQKGFTILEAVFAAGILAFAILSYTYLKTSSRHSQVYSKNLSQAIELAQLQMDDFIVQGYNDDLLKATSGSLHQYSEVGTLKIGDFAFDDATWRVTEGSPSQLCKLIKFKGQWNLPGNPKEIELTQVQVRP